MTSELEKIDQAIRVQLDILRHSANTEARVVVLLEGMRKELIAKLAAERITNFSRVRLNQMLRDTNAVIDEYYLRAQAILSPTYDMVAGVSAGQTAVVLAVTTPPKAVLKTLVTNMLIEGAPSKAWWDKMSTDTKFRFSSTVRQGVAQSETMEQIFRRVNDTVGLAERNSRQLVQTSIMQVMNDAAVEVIQQNADVAPKVRWLATLDSHTCPQCAPRDGLQWDSVTLKPIGHTLPYSGAPLHISCRCKLVPVTRLSEHMEGERASQFGPVDRKTTFGQFLKRQSPAFQDEVLGKGRADLYRAGKVTLRDLVSGNGSPLTLKQLERRYAK